MPACKLKGRHAHFAHRPQAAQACLEHALVLHPDSPQVHLRLGTLLRSQGDLLRARFHAEQAAAASGAGTISEVAQTARVLAAELARSLLLPELAQSWLEITWMSPGTDLGESGDSIGQTSPVTGAIQFAAGHCLEAELALDREQDVAAAQALNGAAERYAHLIRVQALLARLAYRRGDMTLASDTFEHAYQTVTADKTSSGQYNTDDMLGLSLAAIDLGAWEPAFELIDRIMEIAPNEPFVHLIRARAMIIRAEHQRFCQSLDAILHAPGIHALSGEIYQACKDAIQSALLALNLETLVAAPDLLRRWNVAPGGIPFAREYQGIASPAADPLDHAALIAAFSSMAI
jgi:Tfp pilus assembly protein PilF